VGRLEDLAKLDRAVKDAEIRLHTVHSSIVGLDKELDTLSNLEDTLEENLKCLKNSSTIPIASEYKKAKEDLKKTRLRATALQNDRAHYHKAKAEVEASVAKIKEEIEKLKKGDDNVLHANFGRKDD